MGCSGARLPGGMRSPNSSRTRSARSGNCCSAAGFATSCGTTSGSAAGRSRSLPASITTSGAVLAKCCRSCASAFIMTGTGSGHTATATLATRGRTSSMSPAGRSAIPRKARPASCASAAALAMRTTPPPPTPKSRFSISNRCRSSLKSADCRKAASIRRPAPPNSSSAPQGSTWETSCISRVE